MSLTFEPLRKWFDSKNKKRTEMYTTCKFSPTTVAKLWDDRFPVRSDVIETICRTYKLRIENVIEYVEGE
ncbi:helix-turn-helix domain-containing protein [Paenibacillus apiarius]|uniref:helix-turn-helix domain-containing protein n=1 Tax=Paenibacillus apiarius TaxID=46240 RepID=UPI003B3A51EE